MKTFGISIFYRNYFVECQKSNYWIKFVEKLREKYVKLSHSGIMIMSLEYAACEKKGTASELRILMMNLMLPCYNTIQYNVCVQTMRKFHIKLIRFSVTECHLCWWLSAPMLKCQNYFHTFFIRMKTNNPDSFSVRIHSSNNIINWEISQKRAALIITAPKGAKDAMVALAWT